MQSFGRQFTVLASIDSTNNYAMQQAHAGLAKHGDTWFALDQFQGKGQRQKQWISNPGENIMMSIVTEPRELSPANPFLLVAAVAVGVFDFFKHYAGENTSIKWPNDIYWGDRKTVGILIENVIRNQSWLYAIIGTGVNINQAEFNGYNATSLLVITGKKFDVVELGKELCGFLETRYDQLLAGNANVILNDYRQAMYKLGETVTFKRGELIFNALIKDITSDGLLVVETDKEEKLSWGSVEWLINV